MEKKSKSHSNKFSAATFAAGCFWGVEEIFRKLKGVKETAVGYTGGKTKNPTYQQVCSDFTGHAEAVQLKFDPTEVSYEELLSVFWNMHNPTLLNRQGPDFGSQYRSAIFFHSKEQETLAQKSKEKLAGSGKFSRPIVTEIVPAVEFYRAEEYHQKYLMKNHLEGCS